MSESYRLDLLLSDLLQEYQDGNVGTFGANSQRLYKYAIGHYSRMLGRPATLGDMTDKGAGDYIRFRQSEGIAASTIQFECAKLLALRRWSAVRNWCPHPLIKVRKSRPNVPDAWKPEELKRLYSALEKIPRPVLGAYRIGGVPSYLVMPAFIRLALDTAERFTALKLVEWSDFDGRFVTFRASTRKGGDKATDNTQKITRRTQKALAALRAKTPRTSLVFPHASAGTWYHHYDQVLDLAGLPKNRRDKFHKLRRTHATFVHLAGGDATAALGHSSDAVTRTHYLDPKLCHRGYGADLMQSTMSRLFGRMKNALGF